MRELLKEQNRNILFGSAIGHCEYLDMQLRTEIGAGRMCFVETPQALSCDSPRTRMNPQRTETKRYEHWRSTTNPYEAARNRLMEPATGAAQGSREGATSQNKDGIRVK